MRSACGMGRASESRKEQRVESLTIESLGTGAFALVVALFFYAKVKSGPEGNESMARIARYIREGAMAFLVTEYKVLALYAVVVFGLLAAKLGIASGLSFLAGAGLSLGAGFLGMKAATYANVRTAEAARTKGMAEALVTALDGGAVMGLCVAGLGLLGMGGLYGLYHAGDMTLMAGAEHKHVFGTVIHSFAVGASSIVRPRYSTSTRSHRRRTTARLWLTNRIVMPKSRFSSFSRLTICAWIETSSALTGSSQISSFGRSTIARAMPMRWHCPPLNSCG